MKKIFIGLFALGSFSTFAAESLKSIPQGAIRAGVLTSATYEFNKIEYREADGFKPRKDREVLVTLSGIEQTRNSAYSNNVGQRGSENLGGPATDIKTKLNIRISDGDNNYGCVLISTTLSDGFDPLGYDQEELKCDKELQGRKGRMIIQLIDNSENRVQGVQTHYRLIVKLFEEGGFFNRDTEIFYEAEIKAK
jgi:hypothetical protein